MNSFEAHFYQSIRVATRSRLPAVAVWLLVTMVVSVLLAGQFSARQPATVGLDVGFSIIKLSLPLLVILLAQELFGREFERKLYLNSFAYPHSRSQWLFGRLATILLSGVIFLVIAGILLAALTKYISLGYAQGTPITLGSPYLVTLLFIAIDLLVVATIAVLLSIATTNSSFVLIGTIGFTLIARSYTPVIELLRNNPYAVGTFTDPRIYQDSLGLLAFLLPDLGRLDVRMIALYDKMAFFPNDWGLLLAATLAYTAALLSISAWILNKRELN